MTTRNILLCAAAACLALGVTSAEAASAKAPAKAAPAAAQPAGYQPPKDLTYLPPVPKDYQPKRTEWGDPDFRGVWPIDHLGGMVLQRTAAQGKRVWLTPEEYKAAEERMDRSRKAADAEDKANKLGMGHWVEMTGAGLRTSLLVAPDNGRLPELTPEGKRLQAIGRSSWVRDQTYDWVTDFDSWDRCISRGFPASMLPFRYNNGIQVFQSPGYVIISLEMIHDSRIIPIGNSPAVPQQVRTWMGQSRGHWEGNTLVIETDNIRTGASPLNMATIGAPPNNTIPMSEKAHVTERLTMTGPNTIIYEMTFSDPVYWTAPWTVRLDWQRNSSYGMFEYACHEGDEQIRNYIVASRSQRAKDKAKPQASDQTKQQPGG
jgi:hypothetical protein